jgi:NAD(P)-dependent dehydrogenase (short-subunit alcohol dehydrogenase family)
MAGRFLAGAHAVVTGGGRGIGAAIADELGRLGAALTLMGRDEDRLGATARDVASRHGVTVRSVRCDVADADSVSAAFARASDELGDVGVLVNNAGQSESEPFTNTSRALWDRMLAVNLTSAYLCISQVLPRMIEAGGGRIINIASTAGLRGYSRTAAYSASKHGLIGLTRALALETAKLGITVNAVCPGYTDTEMAAVAIGNIVAGTGKSPQEARAMITRVNPRGELIRPEEVASAVGWLCAPESRAVTGQSIVVAGGEVT